MVQEGNCAVGWARLACFPSKILSYSPSFVGTGIVVEKQDVLGGVDWALAGNLSADFGQNCFCII